MTRPGLLSEDSERAPGGHNFRLIGSCNDGAESTIISGILHLRSPDTFISIDTLRGWFTVTEFPK